MLLPCPPRNELEYYVRLISFFFKDMSKIILPVLDIPRPTVSCSCFRGIFKNVRPEFLVVASSYDRLAINVHFKNF